MVMEAQVARVCSTDSEKRRAERVKKAEVELPWRRRAPKNVEPARRELSTVFEAVPPKARHRRPLSHSKVGLAGSSPHYVRIRGASPTRETACKKRIDDCLRKGTLEECWMIYIEAAAWYQDDSPWPIQNIEFVKVRKRIAKLLKEQMREALASDDLEDLEKAEKAATSKIEILGFQGNNKFPELRDIQARLQMMRAFDSGNVGQLESVISRARRSTVNQSIIDLGEKEHAKAIARVALDQAVKDGDIAALRDAIALCFKRGVDEKVVLGAMKHIRVNSKYFASEFEGSMAMEKQRSTNNVSSEETSDSMGKTYSTMSLKSTRSMGNEPSFTRVNSSKVGQLFAKNCFKDEGRAFHLLNLGPDMDLHLFARCLQWSGVTVHFHKEVEAIMTPEILTRPELNTIWVVSGAEPAVLEKNMAVVSKLAEFNRAGGGLGIIASGTRGKAQYNIPLIKDANLLLAKLGLGQIPASGNFEGKQILEKIAAEGSSGISTTHPVLENISSLAEGWTLTELNEGLLRQGFTELVRASTGTLLTAIREPTLGSSETSGPVLVHGSAVQLLCSKEGVGQELFMGNLGIYTCLRSKDVYEVFEHTSDTF